MSEHKHTPGPWKIHQTEMDGPIWVLGPGTQNIFIAKMGSNMGQHDVVEMVANAEFICCACNAYDEMLEALEEIMAGCHEQPADTSAYAVDTEAILQACAAIAKARGCAE